ncbi:hypothetical protein [Amycolatopsis sp. GA6-003]|uniref:hypothetical protein n=1 Tax=Amycolatopsis sp. GA6-003 TaxID=2652444 RepID=UPI003916E235
MPPARSVGLYCGDVNPATASRIVRVFPVLSTGLHCGNKGLTGMLDPAVLCANSIAGPPTL